MGHLHNTDHLHSTGHLHNMKELHDTHHHRHLQVTPTFSISAELAILHGPLSHMQASALAVEVLLLHAAEIVAYLWQVLDENWL